MWIWATPAGVAEVSYHSGKASPSESVGIFSLGKGRWVWGQALPPLGHCKIIPSRVFLSCLFWLKCLLRPRVSASCLIPSLCVWVLLGARDTSVPKDWGHCAVWLWGSPFPTGAFGLCVILPLPIIPLLSHFIGFSFLYSVRRPIYFSLFSFQCFLPALCTSLF